ncbi:oxygen-dependent protoporphyrinogen oxidase [Apophysomyces sp. BC1034]|nr:oxygen-dependent protoporphyrinogen oxidase [Apophysomyces sp. BC1015]KAG0177255.1 oxygen-dependent protoporphyrinogen oxidase [Apophysomyces sp. BC1021]KAG0187552.1 oxygen-dependent protoporphyrinogen oxidase [Apophysomyces sp. BC1034]
MSTVAVLGGGISGLSAAYYLSRLAPATTKIILVEGSDRVGGWIRSQRVSRGTYTSPANAQHDQDNGILLESGPRSLRPQGANGAILLEMVRDLGLTDSLLTVPKSAASAKNRYIYYDDKINKLPTDLTSLLLDKPPIFKSVMLAAMREPFVRSKFKDTLEGGDDESLYSFMKRRFNEHVALNLMGAMTHGIYAGDVKALSVKSTMRLLYENERVYGSVIKGFVKGAKVETFRERGMAARARQEAPEWFGEMEKMSVIGFRQGTQMLPDQLRAWLEGCANVEIITDDPVERIDLVGDKECKIKTRSSEIYAEHVISALPAKTMDRLVDLPHLDYNPSADVAVVNLTYAPDEVDLKYDGFGFLTPHPDSPSKMPVPGTLGVVFDSNAMPGQDKEPLVKLTAMMGGHAWSQAFGQVPIEQLDPNEALLYARKAMKAYLGIDATPQHAMVNLQAKCIPQYLVGHDQRLGELSAAMKARCGHLLSVVGASYLGVSVPDCIKNSRALVEELLVSGALGSKEKIVTGLQRAEEDDDPAKVRDSARISKSHINILMQS